jgi:hypothetical protein
MIGGLFWWSQFIPKAISFAILILVNNVSWISSVQRSKRYNKWTQDVVRVCAWVKWMRVKFWNVLGSWRTCCKSLFISSVTIISFPGCVHAPINKQMLGWNIDLTIWKRERERERERERDQNLLEKSNWFKSYDEDNGAIKSYLREYFNFPSKIFKLFFIQILFD